MRAAGGAIGPWSHFGVRCSAARWGMRLLLAALAALAAAPARASFLSGEALDKAADVLTIAILIVVPIAGETR